MTSQLQRFTSRSAAMLALLLVAGAATAAPPYYVSSNIVFTATPTCDSNGVSGPVTGSLTLNLPDVPGNLYQSTSINANPPTIIVQTFTATFPLTAPATSFFVATSVSTAPPYTYSGFGFAAIDGQPVGLGFHVFGQCFADGTATAFVENGVAAPAAAPATPVPALSVWLQAVLASALAGLAMLALARRRLSTTRR